MGLGLGFGFGLEFGFGFGSGFGFGFGLWVMGERDGAVLVLVEMKQHLLLPPHHAQLDDERQAPQHAEQQHRPIAHAEGPAQERVPPARADRGKVQARRPPPGLELGLGFGFGSGLGLGLGSRV